MSVVWCYIVYKGGRKIGEYKGQERVRVMHGCCAGAETMEYRRDQDSWNTLIRVGLNFQLCVNLSFEMLSCLKQRDEETVR